MKAVGAVVALIATVSSVGGAAGQAAVGVRGGVNLAELTGVEGAESITGITAGGFFGFGLSDQLALQAEALFSIRGGENIPIGANTLDPAAGGSRIEMQAIEVPVLLRAGFPGERFLPSAFVGPYISFLLSCDLQDPAGTTSDCDSPARANWFSPRATNYGLLFGVALDYLMGESSVFVDLRYGLGLLSIRSGEEGFESRNTGLTITGGFAFPLGR